MILGFPKRLIGYIVNLINSMLLSFAYLIGIGSVWLIARIIGKRFLESDESGIGHEKESYWKDTRSENKKDKSSIYRQF